MYATQQLRDEHELILGVLAALEELAGRLQDGRTVSHDRLGEIIEFLQVFADKCHHGKEEDILFPALGRAGIPTEGGPIGVMLMEHDQGRAYIREMMDALGRLRAGQDAGRAFAETALGYVSLLRAHIQKENTVLFVMAENYLSPEVHARLAQQFGQVERERIGAGVHERFHHLAHELAAA